jgi:hypothetical protein
VSGGGVNYGIFATGSNHFFGGNVGIGTSSPLGSATERTLHLSDGGAGFTTLYVTNGANTLRGIFAIANAASSIAIGSQSNHDFRIVTNDIERMRISGSNGNVGIGTSNPQGSYMLTVCGDSSSKTGGITFRQTSTDTFYMGNPSVTNTTDFELWNPRDGYTRFATNNTERMRITSGGNVGIGTTPATYVEINRLFSVGSAQVDYLRLTSSQGGAWFSQLGIQFRWNDFGNGAAWNMASILASPTWNGTTTGGGDLVFNTKTYASPLSTEPTEKMRIYASGAVTKNLQPFVIGGLDGNQSISLNTFTTLNFSTSVGMFYYANVGNCWNNSTRAFTAPVTGVYMVTLSVLTDSIGQVALHVNGARRHSIPSPPYTGTVTWGGTAMIPLSSGEVLTLQGYGNAGTVQQNTFHTFFSIYLLG